MDTTAADLARKRWAKARRSEKTCPFCGCTYRGVKEQVYCSPSHQNAAAARRSREKRKALPPTTRRAATPSEALAAALARALAEIDRYRAAGDLEAAVRWEQIAAGIAVAADGVA